MTDTLLSSPPSPDVALLSRLPAVLRPHQNLLTYYVLASLPEVDPVFRTTSFFASAADLDVGGRHDEAAE